MITKILSGGLLGIDGCQVTVEVDITQGIPAMEIVGLPDSSIKESKERVRSALKNSGFSFPQKRITINLAPANTRKEGSYFDLPIAMGILVQMGKIQSFAANNTFFAGELSLDGQIRHVTGILPMVHFCSLNGINKFIVPAENYEEASLIADIEVIGVNHLRQLADYLNGGDPPRINLEESPGEEAEYQDFEDIKGQVNVIRALTVAATGGHNILMIGPPGSGKTMMAKRIPSILPGLTLEESITTTKIYSVAGYLKNRNVLIKNRPFRSPHHTISYAALVGGGRLIRPGEISLAHNGVLFLDELPEFNRNVLEVLRQPLEEKEVHISRAAGNVTYPANFMLVTSMNPCPCGYYSVGDKCTCTPTQISRYISKISGPLLDRIDIHIEVNRLDYSSLGAGKAGATSRELKEKVHTARDIQARRYKSEKTNALLTAKEIESYCSLSAEGKALLEQIFDTLDLSARAYHKILKIARTIADLESREDISLVHLTEAIGYRSLDRKYFS